MSARHWYELAELAGRPLTAGRRHELQLHDASRLLREPARRKCSQALNIMSEQRQIVPKLFLGQPPSSTTVRNTSASKVGCCSGQTYACHHMRLGFPTRGLPLQWLDQALGAICFSSMSRFGDEPGPRSNSEYLDLAHFQPFSAFFGQCPIVAYGRGFRIGARLLATNTSSTWRGDVTPG